MNPDGLHRMECPACGHRVKFEHDQIGQEVPCPNCGETVLLQSVEIPIPKPIVPVPKLAETPPVAPSVSYDPSLYRPTVATMLDIVAGITLLCGIIGAMFIGADGNPAFGLVVFASSVVSATVFCALASIIDHLHSLLNAVRQLSGKK